MNVSWPSVKDTVSKSGLGAWMWANKLRLINKRVKLDLGMWCLMHPPSPAVQHFVLSIVAQLEFWKTISKQANLDSSHGANTSTPPNSSNEATRHLPTNQISECPEEEPTALQATGKQRTASKDWDCLLWMKTSGEEGRRQKTRRINFKGRSPLRNVVVPRKTPAGGQDFAPQRGTHIRARPVSFSYW